MTVTVILASALLILSSGCQDYIRDRQFEKLEDYVYGFVEDISTNPLTVISDNSVKKVKLPELTDDQQEIFDDTFEYKIKIIEMEISDDNKSADCKVKVNTYDLEEKYEATDFRTVKEYKSEIKDFKSEKKSLVLHLEQVDRKWKFSDLQELVDVTAGRYTKLNICDEDGFPSILTTEYFDSVFIEALWYDPMFSTPLHLNKLTDPVALQCAFYFNTPVNLKFEAVLKDDDGNELASSDVIIDNSVIAVVDFSTDYVGVDSFKKGNYTVELLWNDEEFAKTENSLEVK